MTPTLLLVDDDPVFSQLLAHSLRQHALTVETASNVHEAQQCFQAQSFQYALLDLNLDGESGLSLMQSLLQHDPHCKIVILTGYASVANAVDAIKMGAINYLCKPAKTEDILKAFEAEPTTELPPTNEEMNPMSVKRMEWEHIQRVLQEHEGNISATAKALNMHRRTLQRKLQKRPVQQ